MVTAFGQKNVAESYKIAEGVGCEACHGPGSLYRKNTIMKDQKAAIAVGMVIPDEKTCLKCHQANTKGHDGKFTDFKTEYAKIAHPTPKK
jgi:cytochrome c551/c552